jgi:hypothetical protein
VAVDARATTFADLSETERDAVVAAATWYAKRHASIIAGLADDRSAMALAERERYQDLYDGLAKLGVRLHRPAGIRPA